MRSLAVLVFCVLSGSACTEAPASREPSTGETGATSETEAPPEPEVGIPISGDDMVVSGRVRIRPGTYHVVDANNDGVLQIRDADTHVDLTGVTLVGSQPGAEPDAFNGRGVVVNGATGATISGGTVRGFKVAISVRASNGTVVEDADVSDNFRQRLHSTVEKEDLRDWLRPHDNERGEWEEKYGAGISVADSQAVEIRRCHARRGQNGLLLTRCKGARVYDNDFSFLSGWGIALYRSSRGVICRNRLDWCVRGYSHGIYDRGQDSAGILLFEQCSHNWIALNSATHGGDGLFLYAGEETLRRTGAGGSNHNVVVGNDFSHAVANAIEATFSAGNVFERNRLDDSRHGVWAGYSRATRIRDNRIRGSDHGISIEHGFANFIEQNEIVDCGNGVHLWWDADPGLADTAFGRAHDTRSVENRVGPFNVFRGNRRDVWLQDDRDGRIVDNTLDGKPPRIRLEGNCAGLLLESNTSDYASIVIEAHHEGRVRAVGTGDVLDAPTIEGPGKVVVEKRPPDRMRHLGHAPDEVPLIDETALPGAQDPFLPAGSPRGRAMILVDEWGPVDPRQTRLFPSRVEGVGEAVLSVLGVDGVYRVTGTTGNVIVDESGGALPAVLRVRPADDASGIVPFTIEVTAGGTPHRAEGSLFVARWNVAYFDWEVDPREDPGAWTALLAGEPLGTESLDDLHLRWDGSAPLRGVPPDGFGTRATTTLDLPAGRYRLRTVSDDGIRVWLDDELVIDDWTHHAPTERDAVRDLDAGRHTIRVEHFELDGWAALSVRLSLD